MKRHVLILSALLMLGASSAHAITTEALMDSVQHASFRFLWYEANPANGLVRDRSQSGSPASTAAVGFALSGITVGIDHGWITREQGRDRVKTTLETLWTKPQGSTSDGFIGYKGLFYHFLDMSTGLRTWTSELSTIDTALLFAGILQAREYFTGSDTSETRIRALADSITYRADWKFMQNSGSALKMGWKPTSELNGGFASFGNWVGYNEAMIMYVIAMGSPTHPANNGSPWTSWTSQYSWQTHYGKSYVNFPPLFGHQYSHCWIDFRYINDAYMTSKGITYFENSRRATLAQRIYAIKNPLGRVGYSDSLWGLTASDGPANSYNARGAPPTMNDDGTITPTAALSSIPFAPDSTIPVMHKLWNTYKTELWGPYGFKDAMNLTANPDWFDSDYLGIDQGPIVLMIENYRNSSVWNRFMMNTQVKAGLAAAGFTRTVTGVEQPLYGGSLELLANEPNPFHESTTLRFRLARESHVRLIVFDVSGREVAQLADKVFPAGLQRVALNGTQLQSGVYYARLEAQGRADVRRIVLFR